MDDPNGHSSQFSNHIDGLSVRDSRFLTSTYLFGTCASWMFVSFIIIQAFTYFRYYYKKDSKFLRSIVCLVILLQFLETGTRSYEAYASVSLGWGNPFTIHRHSVVIADDMGPIFVSLTSFIVQYFFIWRIWTLSKSFIMEPIAKWIFKFVCVITALGSFLLLAAAFTLSLTDLIVTTAAWWERTALVIWNISSAAVDVLITTCMMALLLHAKAGSAFEETRDLISRLIRNVLQTGLLTSILAILVLPPFYRKLIGLYALPWYILGKSQVISLLANLNARRRANPSVLHGDNNSQPLQRPVNSSALVLPTCNHHSEGESKSILTSQSSKPMECELGSRNV